MHLFFIDDSGSLPNGASLVHNHFVLGGLVIPEEQWHNLEKDFSRLCKKFQVKGEVKWRFFGQKIGRTDKRNSLSHLTIQERDELRSCLLAAVTKYNSVKIIASVTRLKNLRLVPCAHVEDVYSQAYKPLTERFQCYLQDLSRTSGSKFNGIIICDHRNPNQDRLLSNFHNDLLKLGQNWKSKYDNLIEHLFLSSSHYSIGLQYADLVAGAIFRYFEHGDDRWYNILAKSFRTDPRNGQIEGYGLVKIPYGKWEENDAETGEPPEPAIMTQSQRISNHI